MQDKKQVFNPFLPLYEYIPDGEPHVFGERVYLYGSHDRFDGNQYCMNDYVCYSADIHDLTDWRYEGVIYRKNQDTENPEGVHCLWAPDVVRGLDGRYYLYYCFDVLPEVRVAVCDTPAGSYEYLGLVRYPDGIVLGRKEGDLIQFDPGVFIDEDQTVYLYSGNAPRRLEDTAAKGSQVMTLCHDMLTIKEKPRKLLPTLRDSRGSGFEGHEFYEASSIRKINGKYYFVYSDVQSFALCYAVSDRPDRGYQFGGQLVTLGDVGYHGRTEQEALNFLGNIHGGMECIHGRWYVFYHRQTNWTQFSRQACAQRITILPDGTIPQVEMTSCGLNGAPLSGKGSYPAAIACNLWAGKGAVFSLPSLRDGRYPYFTQDGVDREKDPDQHIANMKDGATAGYKYFQFYGTKGIEVTVRGKGKGCFRVMTDICGAAVGEIPIDTGSGNWESFSGEVNIPDGEAPLYFQYQGEGALDFISFGLF